MSRTVKQVILTVFFVGLLGAAFALKYTSGTPDDEGDQGKEAALKRYGFWLEEVSKKSGIDFVHQAPSEVDSKLDHILPIIASMGASVSVVDFDRDGLDDLYVINSGEGSKNRLYRNKGDGTFEDVAEKLGIADLNQNSKKNKTGVCIGAVWGDYDNDGYEDLLVYKWGKTELFHNDQGKGFTRVTERSGLPEWANIGSAVWLDFDNDGHLDLFMAGYWQDDLNLWKLNGNTKIMPNSFEYATNGGSKFLLRGKGDGTFENVTKQMGIDDSKVKRWTLAVSAGNLCGSAYPDLFVANDYGVSEVFANRKGKLFVEIGKNSDTMVKPKSGMNATFGDISNRGQFSVYVSNISEAKQIVQGNNLWVPKRGTSGEGLQFENLATSLDVHLGGWSWGVQFGDLNNDGLLDLYLTNGYISANKGESYWYKYSLIAGALKDIIVDAENWAPIKDMSLSGYQKKCLWWNRGGKFTDIARAVGVSDSYDGRAVALADLGKRGVLDVVVANQKGPLLVYRNTVAGDNEWVQFELEGTRSNRSAIGASVRLVWKDGEQLQEVSGGNGYASQNMRRLHFGLGKEPQVQKAVIRWPSGLTQTIESPKTGMIHKIKEPAQ